MCLNLYQEKEQLIQTNKEKKYEQQPVYQLRTVSCTMYLHVLLHYCTLEISCFRDGTIKLWEKQNDSYTCVYTLKVGVCYMLNSNFGFLILLLLI